MKKFRKGFTLVELLIVIGIMGTLSSLAMIAGQEASDAAKATNIADGLEKVAIAAMAYYADNAEIIDVNGATTKDVVDGANAYLKVAVVEDKDIAEGKYAIGLYGEGSTAKWMVAYKLAKTDGNVGKVLKNKTKRMGLKSNGEGNTIQDYDGGSLVYMIIR